MKTEKLSPWLLLSTFDIRHSTLAPRPSTLGPGLLPSAFDIRHSTLALALILQLSSLLPLLAAPFNCGSTGAYGAMNITNNTTLQLPPDGIFHCTTITVASGATLTFSTNTLNTPVYLLATGDVTINGTIDLSAQGRKGGVGGFDGGSGGSIFVGQSQGGDGCGPGGGISGVASASFGTSGFGASNTNTYGNMLLSPLIGGSSGPGSAGSPGLSGGGGGGALLLASNSRIDVNGSIICIGNSGPNYYIIHSMGSGGAIRLVSPVVGGIGTLNTKGGDGANSLFGGSGRVRIDCQDNQAYRSLSIPYGISSRGNRMIVFPANPQYLDIIEVAGNAIPQGTNAPALFELPEGASTNQTVKVQGRGFTNDVPIRVVITPENGPRGEFDATILQSSGNPPFAIVPVVIPTGSACQVHAWTR